MTITQGGQTSAPVSLAIQALPPSSAYGTTLGQITQAFLEYNALVHARQINALQAAGLVAGIDTTAAQAGANQAILDSIHSQVDINAIVQNPAATLSWGTASDGTPLNFSQVDLDLMDRILGAYITTQFPSNDQIAAVNGRTRAQTLRRSGNQLVLGRTAVQRLKIEPQGLITSFLQQLTGATTVGNAGLSFLTSNNALDASSAVASGVEPYLNSPTWTSSSGILGVISGLTQVNSAMAGLASNLDLAFQCAASTSTSCTQTAADNFQNSALNVVNNIIQTVASIPSIIGAGNAVTSAISSTVSFGTNLATTFANYWVNGTTGSSFIDSALSAYNAITTAASSVMSGDGIVQGGSDITYSSPVVGLGPPMATMQLCCFGPSQLPITTTADANGNYSFDVPTGVAGTTYSGLTLTALDPTSGDVIGTIPVNLSGLTPMGSSTVPTTLTGSCIDDDSDAYDDPDCD
jgi:hypothetical protein